MLVFVSCLRKRNILFDCLQGSVCSIQTSEEVEPKFYFFQPSVSFLTEMCQRVPLKLEVRESHRIARAFDLFPAFLHVILLRAEDYQDEDFMDQMTKYNKSY
ncbi:hypothetical protein FHG87_013446 [Trinorchestia longiramus]|nr:hypothetical protein FHG87_013446 [Trinorchestia longiramus]